MPSGNDDVHITFFARGEHLKKIQKSGLLLKTENNEPIICKPDLATDSLNAVPKPDICIICVKEFDLAPLLKSLTEHISDSTIILPLLNGADIYQRIRSVIKNGIVLPACVYVGTHIEKPGVVTQQGGACKILFGPDPRDKNSRIEVISELFQNARILHEFHSDIFSYIWEKFIFIASFGMMTAAYDKTIGEVMDNDFLKTESTMLIGEITSIALKMGISLPTDIVVATLTKASTFPYNTKTSFQRDFENRNKKDERDLFAGTILRHAKRLQTESVQTEKLLRRLETLKPSV